MVDREDMYLGISHQPVDHAVGSMDEFAEPRAWELRHFTPGLWKLPQALGGKKQAPNDNVCEIR